MFMELEGYVENYTFIPKPKHKDADTERRLKAFKTGMINSYSHMRFALKKDGSGYLKDSVARLITCPSVIDYANNGARPGAKISGDKKMTGVRAIENNERDVLSDMFMGYYFGAGQALCKMKNLDSLNTKQMMDVLKDEEFKHCLLDTAVAGAVRAKAARNFELVGFQNATFDKVIALGRSVNVVKQDRGGKGGQLQYDGMDNGVTEEQAFMAKLYYDRVLFLGIMNIIHAGQFDQLSVKEIIETVRPHDGALELDTQWSMLREYPEAGYTIAEHDKNQKMTRVVHRIDSISASSKEGP